MEAIQARVASFKKNKRVKNPEKPSSTITLKWPHPADFRANPATLAEAGFYYDPSYDDNDNVTCYICEKQLGGWEEDDDPFSIHWDKCGQSCCWASVRCGLMADVDQSGRFIFSDKTRFPAHKSMENARFNTFKIGKGWIHDMVKNHGANSQMMARAGFVYTPQHSGDDLATCLYCNTSLSGWDEDDDPLEEHRKRQDKSGFPCPFFAPPFEGAKPALRSHPSKPSSKTLSKPPSRSTSKSKYQDIVLPTKIFDGEDDEIDPPESSNVEQSSAKTPRKARATTSTTRKSSAKTPKSKTRSSSRSGLKKVAEEVGEEDLELEPPPTVKKKALSRSKSVAKTDIQPRDEQLEPPPTVKKKARSRSKSVVKSDAQTEEIEDVAQETPPTVKKKAQSRSKSVARSNVHTEEAVEDSLVEAPPKKKARSRSKSVTRPELQTEPETEEDTTETRKPMRAKTKKVASDTEEGIPRKPSRSKSKAPLASSVADDDAPRKPSRTTARAKVVETEHEEPKTTAKPKHHRTASKSKSKPQLPVPEPESESEPEVVSKKLPSKSKPPQNPEVKDLFNDDITMEISTSSLSSPTPGSAHNSMADLPPLFVPKRNMASKPSAPPRHPEVKQDQKKSGKPTPASPLLQEDIKDTELPPSNDIVEPAASSSIKPTPKPSSLKEKAASKPKPAPEATAEPEKQKMKVVEISSDEEVEPETDKKSVRVNIPKQVKNISTPCASSSQSPPGRQPSRPVSAQSKREKKMILVETVQPPRSPQPLSPTRLSSPPQPAPVPDTDVSMGNVDSETERMDGNLLEPSTPPRLTTPLPFWGATKPVQQKDIIKNLPPVENKPIDVHAEPPIIPALSKLPFVPLHSLSEAELDMTVEEWIRYQMEVEFDKFRRDGERELQRFRKQAEDVRKVIEGL